MTKLLRAVAVAMAMILSLGVAGLGARDASAMSQDGRRLLTMGGYGLVGGTVLGLAQYPFTHNTKNIFVGTSIGLYLGLALGVFYVLNDYDTPKPEPDRFSLREPSSSSPYAMESASLQVGAPVLRF